MMNFAFHSFSDFLSMGHRGVFVWSAWLLTLAALIFLVMQARYARQQFFRIEDARLRRAKARALNNDQAQEH